MSDSLGRSALVGRIAAGVAAGISVVAGLIGYNVTPEMAAQAGDIINNGYQVVSAGAGVVSMVLAWWSKFRESKKP